MKYLHTKSNGNIAVELDGGLPCTINEEEYPAQWAEITAYLLDHPEALVTEPVPPPPTGEELAQRRVAEARAYLASTDWIIAKIGEAQMLGQDIAGLVEKYQDVLDARGAARETINEGEA